MVVDECILDLLSIMAKCAPTIITAKPKFHLLLHVTEYIRRFGPAILFSSECFESFNKVFRIASVMSNRLSPSRDIAIYFGDLERVRHVATGGWWKDSESGKWVRGSEDLRLHLRNQPEHARLLGVPVPVDVQPGLCRVEFIMRSLMVFTVILAGQLKHFVQVSRTGCKLVTSRYSNTRAATCSSSHATPNANLQRSDFIFAKKIVCMNITDRASVGSKVIAQTEGVRSFCIKHYVR
jgi:hypothetical protein